MKKLFIFINRSILLLILLYSSFAVCQDIKLKAIDKLLKESNKKHTEYKDLEELQIAKKANILSKNIGDEKRIAESSYIISRALSCLELQKQSLAFVQKTFDLHYIQKDVLLRAKLKEIKSYNFYVLSLKSQSSHELRSIVNLLKEKKDTASIHVLARIYGNIGNQYFDKNQLDSAFFYYKLGNNLIKKFNEKEIYRTLCENYVAVGNAFSKKKSFDSALYY
ncbi:hypothetical protein SAMN05880574_1291 [Chryseobacterium sp. RU37D]|uniref:hypothetical protein n=1 Tax=Chryseobacterium sp. RU37D TaxID=1907397 RepID=UPI000954D29F|nr:hypothetical protein [Chryseobacterium sp. RU37D]SIQ85285.1 hypothetical protein SAMN05880574_1291 [Chryseobacterium sp. RU37D]